MSRCYGCCQENCGYTHCTCACHDSVTPRTHTPTTSAPTPKINFANKPPAGVLQPYGGKPPVGKLTAPYKRFLLLRDTVDEELTRLRAHVEKARAKLVENCTHPAEFVVEYDWEHDNGYGRQAWKKGVRCTICDARCSWPGMSTSWTKKEHQRSRHDD